jgi:hypothetical protein
MTKSHTQIMTDQYFVPKTKYIETPYGLDQSRFVSGWFILPMVLSGSIIWFFILRMAWRFFT